MENLSMARSEYIKESRVTTPRDKTISPKKPRGRTPRQKQQKTSSEQAGEQDLDSIFFDNLNHSYLAKLSGCDRATMKKEKIYSNRNPVLKSRKRIDFETYEGVETDKIYASSFLKGEWDMFDVVNLLEDTEKEVDLTEENDRFLCCAGPRSKLVCKARLLGSSQLQLIKQVGGHDGGLFFALNFDTTKVQVYFHQMKTTSEIVIKTQNFSLIVEPFDRRAGTWWNKQLQKMTEQSCGTKLPLRILNMNPHFYRTRYESEEYFLENCQNGDMLLFQDSHFFARAQRFLTRSQFDHVGIVVRDKKHGVLIFQSNTSSGVCLTPWKYVNMFEWYKNIPRITWRRLHTQRDWSFDKQLEDFVVKTLPRQFHFSLAKLAARESFIMVNESRREDELQLGQTNGFFCSQLAAATYKHMGLLAVDKSHRNYLPASRFYPLDFSEKGELKLEMGYLGEERDIIFQGEKR